MLRAEKGRPARAGPPGPTSMLRSENAVRTGSGARSSSCSTSSSVAPSGIDRPQLRRIATASSSRQAWITALSTDGAPVVVRPLVDARREQVGVAARGDAGEEVATPDGAAWRRLDPRHDVRL